MLSVTSIEEKIVAILHDVVEDTDVTLEEISSNFGWTIKDAVDSVSRRNHCLSKYGCNHSHGCHCECLGCVNNEILYGFY